jgi:hypothetical protein
MKVKHIPGFSKWLKDVVEFQPEYNKAKYFNTMFKMYSRKFRCR